jgi:peptidyl-prolyl cis-trans isomerase D
VAERIRSAPVFAGGDGTFDRSRFDLLLQENRYTEGEFIEIERDAAVQEMWVNGLLGGYTAPTPYLQALNRFANQTRQIAWFELTEEAVGPIPDPSQDELRDFYEENTDLFRAPERRSFAFVTLSAEVLAEPAAVSQGAVRREYERSGMYGQPEQRRVQQVTFDDPVLARRTADALEEGSAFETVLDEMDKTFQDVDLGFVERSDLVDPAVREAAFSLEEGGAAFVDGRFGPVVVRVSQIEEAAKQPFDEVEDEIRQTLAIEEAETLVNDLYVQVEDAVAGGARVGEIAQRFDLPLREVEPVTRRGVAADGDQVDVPSQLLSTAFQLAPGDDAEPVRIDSATAWIQTREVIEAADRPFDEVYGQVLVEWTEAQKTERLATLAEEAVQSIEDGVPVANVAERHDADPRTSEPFSRSEPPQDLPQAVSAAAFEGPEGYAESVIAGPGRHIVFEVTDVSEPAFFEQAADLQPIRTSLNDALANTLLFDFVNAWQAQVGATQNPQIINQIVGIEPRTR